MGCSNCFGKGGDFQKLSHDHLMVNLGMVLAQEHTVMAKHLLKVKSSTIVGLIGSNQLCCLLNGYVILLKVVPFLLPSCFRTKGD